MKKTILIATIFFLTHCSLLFAQDQPAPDAGEPLKSTGQPSKWEHYLAPMALYDGELDKWGGQLTLRGQDEHTIKWPRLIQGKLIQRYQRFKADVKQRNGHIVTAHCPNSGSMLGCSEPGRPVYLSRHNHPKRQLKYTWEMIEMPTSLVGVNTWVPNLLVKESIVRKKIRALRGYKTIRAEVSYGQNSRIDLLLERGERRCFVEVKNCTLVEDGIACFPDAVTSRGLKHLVELQKELRKGSRCVMFYLVQRMDAKRFRPADHIDPAYGQELRRAFRNGVEILVYDVFLNLEGISINRRLPFEL